MDNHKKKRPRGQIPRAAPTPDHAWGSDPLYPQGRIQASKTNEAYTRPPKTHMFMRIAIEVSKQATCRRRQVGCVLVDERQRILSTGFNGVPAGADHCLDHPCAGADLPSGQGLTKCEAIHAEQNAILLLRDPWAVDIAYVTTFPCDGCIKLLLGTSCKHIIYLNEYSHPDAFTRWLETGRRATLLSGLE